MSEELPPAQGADGTAGQADGTAGPGDADAPRGSAPQEGTTAPEGTASPRADRAGPRAEADAGGDATGGTEGATGDTEGGGSSARDRAVEGAAGPSGTTKPNTTGTSGASGASDEPGSCGAAPDPDAWATACAEDLEAEKARRRAERQPPTGSAAEELLKLVDAVAERLDRTDWLSAVRSPLLGAVAGPAAQQVVRQVVQQAKDAVEPVIARNPDVFDHLAAAGSELLAAYRSAVQAQERRWTAGGGSAEGRDDRGEDPGPGERIDLDQ